MSEEFGSRHIIVDHQRSGRRVSNSPPRPSPPGQAASSMLAHTEATVGRSRPEMDADHGRRHWAKARARGRWRGRRRKMPVPEVRTAAAHRSFKLKQQAVMTPLPSARRAVRR